MQLLTFMSNHGFLTGFLGTLFFLLILSIALLISMYFEKKMKLKYDFNNSSVTELKADFKMVLDHVNNNMELKKDEKAKLSDTNYDC